MIIETLPKEIIPYKRDAKGRPVATESQLRAWCELVHPCIHKGQPLPYESAFGWHFPQYITNVNYLSRPLGNSGAYLSEGAALVALVKSLIEIEGYLTVERINEYAKTAAPPPEAQPVAKLYTIGIDAGADKDDDNCGVALYCLTAKKLLWLQTLNPYELIRFLQEIPNRDQVGVVLEDPNAQSATFQASLAKSLALAAKMGQGIGKTMGVALTVIKCLQSLKIDFARVNPTRRTNVSSFLKPSPVHYLPTKTNVRYFGEFCGWVNGSNEHERDAATLVCNRTWEMIWSRKDIDSAEKLWGGKTAVKTAGATKPKTPAAKKKQNDIEWLKRLHEQKNKPKK